MWVLSLVIQEVVYCPHKAGAEQPQDERLQKEQDRSNDNKESGAFSKVDIVPLQMDQIGPSGFPNG